MVVVEIAKLKMGGDAKEPLQCVQNAWMVSSHLFLRSVKLHLQDVLIVWLSKVGTALQVLTVKRFVKMDLLLGLKNVIQEKNKDVWMIAQERPNIMTVSKETELIHQYVHIYQLNKQAKLWFNRVKMSQQL